MRVLIVAPDSRSLKALEASCAWSPPVRVISRVVNSLNDTDSLRGLEFDFAIGLDLLDMDYRPRLAVLIRSPLHG